MLSGRQALLSGKVLSDRRELMKTLVALISIACVGGGADVIRLTQQGIR